MITIVGLTASIFYGGGWGASCLVEHGELTEYVDSKVDARLLKTARGKIDTGSVYKGDFTYFPDYDYQCYYVHHHPVILEHDKIVQFFQKTPTWATIDKEWAAFNDLIVNLNRERARIRFARAALAVLAQVEPQLEARLQLLG